jgi:hypothetical protein
LILPNPAAIASASQDAPIVQTRKVYLKCAGKVVCTATSRVRITSPECARLFLEEKYAIGQMFRRLEKVPAFDLLATGFGPADEPEGNPRSVGDNKRDQELWRKYKLSIPDFECEILEVFPSREMFVVGETWLVDEPTKGVTSSQSEEVKLADRSLRISQSFN